MKFARVMFLLGAWLVLGSCEPFNGADLEMTVVGKNAILIDTDGRSCDSRFFGTGSLDLNPMYFEVRQLKLDWKGDKDLIIAYLTVTLSGGGLAGKYNCKLANTALGAIFNNDNDANTTIPAQSEKETLCPIACGGVSVKDKTRSSGGLLELIIYGYYLDDEGNTIPASARGYGSYAYTGL